MKIKKIKLIAISLPFKAAFQTSYGSLSNKYFYLIEVVDASGLSGYGELEALQLPYYTDEMADAAVVVIEQAIAPLLKGITLAHPNEFNVRTAKIQGNKMAKAAIEMAIWDLYAKIKNIPLCELIGGRQKEVSVGVSVGITESLTELRQVVETFVDQEYSRVKLKIQPGYDLAPVKEIRKHFPYLSLMVDANSSYHRSDITPLFSLDEFGLAMIEQPFLQNDLIQHKNLQEKITTPICLDENICSLEDIKQAYAIGSCRAVNLKPARVGGYAESLQILQFCQEKNILVWCGGMYEAGIGRAHNLALASRPEFHFPGDISATDRYFHEDIITTNFRLKHGKITVPQNIGIGVEPCYSTIEKYKKPIKTITL